MIYLFPMCLFGQAYTSHTIVVDNDELTIFQSAFFYNDLAPFYYIDSIFVDQQGSELRVDLVYDAPPMSHVYGFTSRTDTLIVDSISVGMYRLVVRSFEFVDSAHNPQTGHFFDTLLLKDSDTSFFQILSNPFIALSSQIEVYPNPSNERVWFSGLGQDEVVNVEVIDASGRVRLSAMVRANEPKISISILPPGIYSINLKTDRLTVIKKLLVH